jgi:hypothetical protein
VLFVLHPSNAYLEREGRVSLLMVPKHTQKRDTKKKPSETAGRNGASIAKFRTRRKSHIYETPRYRAILSDIRLSTRRDSLAGAAGFEPLHQGICIPLASML